MHFSVTRVLRWGTQAIVKHSSAGQPVSALMMDINAPTRGIKNGVQAAMGPFNFSFQGLEGKKSTGEIKKRRGLCAKKQIQGNNGKMGKMKTHNQC